MASRRRPCPSCCRRPADGQLGYQEMKWVATAPEDLKGVCFFPFHTHASMEAKLSKPARVAEARAVVYYTPPMEFVWKTRDIEG